MSSILSLMPPSFFMLIGALLIPFMPKHIRVPFVLMIPVLALFRVWQMPVGDDLISLNIAGFNIRPAFAHAYSHIFGTIFCIASFGGALFGLMQSRRIETSAAFLYGGSALGVTFSGDFISLFIYWELMAIGSTLIIFVSDQKNSMQAGMRYALIHFLGGVILMTGIIGQIMLTGTATLVPFEAHTSLLFPEYGLDMNGIIMWLILIGILINAAAPPMSAWIADSYPKSSPFGAVFLSAFTTKTAVFVLLTLFAGTQLLIYLGLFMVFYGIIYAMLENDMRKILSYSIVNQVGFMIIGIGIGTTMALNGTAIHAFAHIVYKALLFMSAGSVLYMTGKSKFTELGGLCRTMKLTMVCGIIGAFSISAFPLTSGFITKSMIVSAVMKEELEMVWYLLMAASAGAFLYVGLKFPWFVFFGKDSGMRPDEPPFNMKLAMIFFSLLCIILGIPGVAEKTIYQMLPVVPDYVVYNKEHVIGQLQLLLFAALAFFLMLPMLKRKDTISLDFDWFYRGLGHYVVSALYYIGRFPARIGLIVAKKIMKKWLKLFTEIYSPEGLLARSWSLGTTVMWAGTFLGIYLVIYYITPN
ncbi:MAG: Na(+)/H(+) antiporter subunit D [Rickettsiales bacterium]|nr:Na(+)/H(+) antiporter subunit D [Pseudomonadota bacterium]MDA0967273.1 Na(+)/H(+) antiporter subunit D [Pseudomonadota bacterium]MDG4544066.1 Na(+)/H(+) antiporter subunit D [Rickettsiales bacterium]MDG4546240.1 Na(+)/H(+) antiporter subunit D [Rickettsiales bacterium]MDG4548390.1 Na(+)/H(+) antiporter subunit D [Rickettsiales bacterium]